MEFKTIVAILCIFVSNICIHSATWQSVNGADGGNITAVFAIDQTVIAGTDPGGIYRSADGAKTWVQCSGTRANAIVGFGRLNSMLVAASKSGALQKYALSFSADTGRTWYENSNPWSFMGIEMIAAHKNSLYVKIQQGQFFQSDDTAKTWKIIDNLPAGVGSFINVKDAYSDSQTIYFAADAGLICTQDNGKTWKDLSGNLPKTSFISTSNNAVMLSCIAVRGDTLFAAKPSEIYRSTDNGKTWNRILRLDVSDVIFKDIFVNNSILMAACTDGLFCSSDRGATWKKQNAATPFNSVNACTASQTAFFAATDKGLFSSENPPADWVSNNFGISSQNIGCFAAVGKTLYAGTVNGGVFVRSGSKSWKIASEKLPGSVQQIAAHDSILYLCTYPDTAGKSGLLKYAYESTTRLNLTYRITGKPADVFQSVNCFGDSLFVGASSGLYMSTDSGLTFREIRPDILGSARVFSISRKLDLFYLGTSDGFFIYNAEKDSLSDPYLASFLGYDYNSGFHFGGGWRSGLQRSSDDGKSWSKTSLAIPETVPIMSIICMNDTVFAGTDGLGIFVSLNNGETWNELNDGLACLQVKKLYLHDGILYAGTDGKGIFELDLKTAKLTSANKTKLTISANRYSIIRTNSDITIFPVSGHLDNCNIGIFSLSGKLRHSRTVHDVSRIKPAIIHLNENNVYIVRVSSGDGSFCSIVNNISDR